LVLIAAVWAGVTLATVAIPRGPGLRGQYVRTARPDAPASITALDSTISTRQIFRRWRSNPPDRFSARWSGYLAIDRPGFYTFATTSDDGSMLFVNGQLVVDNGGEHGPRTREGRVRLTRGAHSVALEYFQSGGPFLLEWSWAYEGEALSRVPARVLSPEPRSRALILGAEFLGWLWWALTIGIAVAAARLGWRWGQRAGPVGDTDRPAFGHEPAAGGLQLPTLLLFVLLACVQTWPLATDPAHLSRHDNADTMLNEWTLAWVAHQLPRAPLGLFDANIFYPERNTLAYSEAMVFQGALAAPLFWLGASPVLAYNILLLAGFALTGWTMALVVTKWTGDLVAGIGSGILIAFNAHTLTRLPHLQAQHAEFLPLALLALDALLRKPRWSSALLLALWFTLQALASVHLLIFAAVALVAAALSRPEDWLGRDNVDRAVKLGAAALLATAALLPVLLPYWRLWNEGFARSVDEAVRYSALPRDYLTTPSRILGLAGHAGGDTSLFPGILSSLLALFAMASGVAFADRRARMCLVAGVTGIWLSFGPAAPGYEFLRDTVPVLQGVRAAARFGYLGLVAVAVLGGFGIAGLRWRLAAHPRARTAAAGAVLIGLCIEPFAAPVGYRRFEGLASIYSSIRSDPRAIVVDIPFEPPRAVTRNAAYMLNSTLHLKPILSGYSGFIPPSYRAHYAALRDFPAPASLRALQTLGVTYVFVHLERIDPETAAAIAGEPALVWRATEGSVVLYALSPEAGR
jgi:hypothetical protein